MLIPAGCLQRHPEVIFNEVKYKQYDYMTTERETKHVPIIKVIYFVKILKPEWAHRKSGKQDSSTDL